MKISISGANGAFGSEIVRHLDNYKTVSLRYGGLGDLERKKLSECEVFVHCGGLLRGSYDELFKSNVLLTKDILDYLTAENPKVHFVYLSSMSLLRKRPKVRSRDYLEFWEMTDYAVSKYISEILCMYSKIPTTVVRFSTLFCRDPMRDGLSRLVFDAVNQKKITILDNGMSRRDFLPLDIAAKYVIKMIGNESLYGRTLNIVSGRETSFREIADFLSSKVRSLAIQDLPNQPLDSVPTDFGTKDISLLGEIKFDLFEEIEKYRKSLLDNTDLLSRG
jgi:nucleoside-diphosphate-sugar epimerase